MAWYLFLIDCMPAGESRSFTIYIVIMVWDNIAGDFGCHYFLIEHKCNIGAEGPISFFQISWKVWSASGGLNEDSVPVCRCLTFVCEWKHVELANVLYIRQHPPSVSNNGGNKIQQLIRTVVKQPLDVKADRDKDITRGICIYISH